MDRVISHHIHEHPWPLPQVGRPRLLLHLTTIRPSHSNIQASSLLGSRRWPLLKFRRPFAHPMGPSLAANGLPCLYSNTPITSKVKARLRPPRRRWRKTKMVLPGTTAPHRKALPSKSWFSIKRNGQAPVIRSHLQLLHPQPTHAPRRKCPSRRRLRRLRLWAFLHMWLGGMAQSGHQRRRQLLLAWK